VHIITMATTNGLFIGLGAATLASALYALAVVSSNPKTNALALAGNPPALSEGSQHAHEIAASSFLGALSPYALQ
jgi:hypothetical protein